MAPNTRTRYPCPCCGFLTLSEPREKAYSFICPVCFWENDIFNLAEDAPSDCNHGLTLLQGRENYSVYGACEESMVKHTRNPRKCELP